MTDGVAADDRTDSQVLGLPIGGVGTGYFELNRRGHFSNFAINNNRFAGQFIPRADGTFLGFRVADANRAIAGVLQHDSSLPFDAAGFGNPCTDKRMIDWTPLYPTATYRLVEMNIPVSLMWRVMSPVIPFDTEASSLPAALIQMEFHNTSDSPCTVSGLFSWENIRGRTGEHDSAARGRVEHCLLREHDRFSAISAFVRELGLKDDEFFPVGLQYGVDDAVSANADGDYTIAGVARPNIPITMQTYDAYDAASLGEMWGGFARTGQLTNSVVPEHGSGCGALCQTKHLAPNERYRFSFVVGWNCPRYELGGTDVGNAYGMEFENSVESAMYLVEYNQILTQAVENWHKRLIDSSFPTWYSRMLINACSVLTTNSLHTLSGSFSLFDSPESPVLSSLARHFYASIGTSVFFPSYAERELSLLSNVEEGEDHDLFRNLGRGAFDAQEIVGEPDDPDTRIVDLYAMYILLIYRNLHTSGRLASMMNQFPRIEAVMAYLLAMDEDSDGLPDAACRTESFPGWPDGKLNSYSCGLWIAALFAYADIAQRQGNSGDAEAIEKHARRALHYFEENLWDPEGRYYKNAQDGEASARACHIGQLAGSWLTRFMRLRAGGTKGWPTIVFDDDRATEAAQNILSWNTRPNGISLATGVQGIPIHEGETEMPPPGPEGIYPALVSPLLAAPLVYQDLADDGLDVIRDIYQHLSRQGRSANYPYGWDAGTGQPAGECQSRDVSALSIWYTYYAFQGLFLSVPDRALFIAPNLPEGVRAFKAPLFTPVCLGDLEWSETVGDQYQQRIKISLDSPIHVERIEIEMPPLDIELELFIKTSEDVSNAEHAVFPGKRHHTVRIELNTAILLQEPIVFTIRELKDGKKPIDKATKLARRSKDRKGSHA